MKHAGPAALDALEPLLKLLRALPPLVERKRGVFYVKSQARLHFHEDPSGLFADFRLTGEGEFERFRVLTASEKARFLATVKRAMPE